MIRVELRDSLENIYPDSVVGSRPLGQMEVDVARGGTIAVHVLMNGLEEGAGVKLRLRDASGTSVRAKWFCLVDVPVEENTGLSSFTSSADKKNNPHVIRRAPFRTYDCMRPVTSHVVAESPTMAFRLHIPVPTSSRPGRRSYSVEIRCGGETWTLQIKARVHKAVIPPVGPDSWGYTIWCSYEYMASRHGLTAWSEPHWRMIRKYADLMVRARQNTFWVPHPTIIRREGGRLVLDRERLRRIVQIGTRAGLHYIEGPILAGRTAGEWEATTYSVQHDGPLAASIEGHRDLANIATQLMEEIEINGWQDRWIQHVADEPTDKQASEYRITAGIIRKYMPGIPLMDALGTTALVGSLDIWCPLTLHYHNDRKQYDDLRQFGDRIWVYTCLAPGGPFLNRLLDQELLRPLLFGWAGVLFDLHGYLHWGLNHYREDQDPFKSSVVGNGPEEQIRKLPAGDTHIVYPGSDGPWSSLRLEAQREGMEDCELLRQLKNRDPALANRIIRRAFRQFDSYTKDVKTLRRARRALLESL
ncbi:MAG: DUF4091 domain-containing protein [Lentisphaerae bacterium]|nr:DUF4091 domain-containing protein [Lentisphaerota bacterium]